MLAAMPATTKPFPARKVAGQPCIRPLSTLRLWRRAGQAGLPPEPALVCAIMPLHLLKLCVGAESIGDLEGWIDERMALRRARSEPLEQLHTTRMVPKKVEEILAGGSLYWVIKGQIAARQRLTDIRPFKDADGIGRCHLVLEPLVVPVAPRPFRPFQGWRYLLDTEAPRDLSGEDSDFGEMPEALRRELAGLGLL